MQAEQIADGYISPSTGRPALLEQPDKLQLLLACLEDGMTQEDACQYAEIALSTYYNWLKRAEQGDENAQRFSDAVRKARAGAKREHLHNIRRAGQHVQQWTASAWFLERSFPEQYGRRNDDSSSPKVVVQIGAKDSDVQVAIHALSPSEPVPSVRLGRLDAIQGEAVND